MKAREVCLTDPEVVPLFWCQQLLQSGAIGENRECGAADRNVGNYRGKIQSE